MSTDQSSTSDCVTVFVSYAHEDSRIACELYQWLAGLDGIRPWIDRYNLSPGENWELAVERVIAQCQIILLLLSRHSVSKEGYVQKEVRLSLERLERMPPDRILLIPARLEDCEPIHPQLRRLNWVDLYPDQREGKKRIRDVLERIRLARLVAHPRVGATSAPNLLTGTWHSNFGDVHIKRREDRVFGTYGHDGTTEGQLEGIVRSDHVLFRWVEDNGSSEGFGSWHIQSGLLVGGWFYKPRDLTFEQFLKIVSPTLVAQMSQEHPWILSRSILETHKTTRLESLR